MHAFFLPLLIIVVAFIFVVAAWIIVIVSLKNRKNSRNFTWRQNGGSPTDPYQKVEYHETTQTDQPENDGTDPSYKRIV